jgi:DNA mismatch endonuclease (patch repair protein)
VARTTEGIDPERSARMRLIKGRDTKPEWIVRRALHAAGLRYRLHAQDLPGRPDIVFRKQRVAIMVHGCFWHQHPDPACRLARMPKSRQEFWRPKLMGNRARDEAVRARLQADGWRVFELWECQLNTEFLARFTSELRALL